MKRLFFREKFEFGNKTKRMDVMRPEQTRTIPAPMRLTRTHFCLWMWVSGVSLACSVTLYHLSLRHRPGPQPGYGWVISLHHKLFWEGLKQAGLGAARDAEVTLKQHKHPFTSCPALLFVPVTSLQASIVLFLQLLLCSALSLISALWATILVRCLDCETVLSVNVRVSFLS